MVGVTLYEVGEHCLNLFDESFENQNFRWDFDRSTYPESVVSQFSLVCENDYWRSLAQVLICLDKLKLNPAAPEYSYNSFSECVHVWIPDRCYWIWHSVR